MRIFDTTKTKELNENTIDYVKGYLKPDKLAIAHHKAVPFKKGKSAYEIANELELQGVVVEKGYGDMFYRVVKEYEGGGKETELIEGEPDKPAIVAYDEYEDIQVYIPYTEEELKERAERKELTALEKWFTEVYDTQVKQYNRCQRLGIDYDNKYGTINELDNQATINAKRISELRKKYSIQ